jgi:hypothetical protein
MLFFIIFNLNTDEGLQNEGARRPILVICHLIFGIVKI